MKALYKNNELIAVIYVDSWVKLDDTHQVSPPVIGWSQEIDGDLYEIKEYTPPAPPPEEEEEPEEVEE